MSSTHLPSFSLRALLVLCALAVVSLLYLPLTGFDPLLLAGFAVFYGLDWVATVPPTVKISAERFGAEKAGLRVVMNRCPAIEHPRLIGNRH